MPAVRLTCCFPCLCFILLAGAARPEHQAGGQLRRAGRVCAAGRQVLQGAGKQLGLHRAWPGVVRAAVLCTAERVLLPLAARVLMPPGIPRTRRLICCDRSNSLLCPPQVDKYTYQLCPYGKASQYKGNSFAAIIPVRLSSPGGQVHLRGVPLRQGLPEGGPLLHLPGHLVGAGGERHPHGLQERAGLLAGPRPIHFGGWLALKPAWLGNGAIALWGGRHALLALSATRAPSQGINTRPFPSLSDQPLSCRSRCCAASGSTWHTWQSPAGGRFGL